MPSEAERPCLLQPVIISSVCSQRPPQRELETARFALEEASRKNQKTRTRQRSPAGAAQSLSASSLKPDRPQGRGRFGFCRTIKKGGRVLSVWCCKFRHFKPQISDTLRPAKYSRFIRIRSLGGHSTARSRFRPPPTKPARPDEARILASVTPRRDWS